MKDMLFFILISSIIFNNKLNAQDSIKYPVFFEYNSSLLDTQEQKTLKLLLNNMAPYEITSIYIRAYCDDRGGKKINGPLSKNRANAIREFIQEKYKDSSLEIIARGMGFIPLNNEDAVEVERKRNRRGEILIHYLRKKDTTPTTPTKGKQAVKPKPKEISIQNFLTNAKVGEKMEIKIFFEGGRHHLYGNSFVLLDSLASMLDSNSRKIRILGHIYANGFPQEIDGYDEDTRQNNLSDARAKEVYKYLINKGIDKNRLEYKGLGGRFPLGLSASRDRRVEIEIIE